MPDTNNNNALQFGADYEKNEYSLIDDGKYEVVIDKVEKKISQKTGRKYLNFTFVIRNDVSQKFKNRRLFYTVVQKNEDSCYDFQKINKIIMTQSWRSDYKTRFEDFDEVLLYLCGLHLVITVETIFDDYLNEDKNAVKDGSFEPSEWDKSGAKPDNGEVSLKSLGLPDSNDDLPW